MASPCSALVISIDDPEGIGRAKVRISQAQIPTPDIWANVLQPFFTSDPALGPEVGDQVLIIFENSDMRYPFVIGRIRNMSDREVRAVRHGT